MVKTIAESMQTVKVEKCRFFAPWRVPEIFWARWRNASREHGHQSCIDFALVFYEEYNEFDDRYFVSLNYDELQNFIDWWRLCIYTYKPVSVDMGIKVFHDRDDIDRDNDWIYEIDEEDLFNSITELQKRKITYYPLNKEQWYLEMQKIPINLTKEHYNIQKITEERTYKKVLVKKDQMIRWIFRDIFLNILCNVEEDYYNPSRYRYLFDTIKNKLWLSQEETMNYINSANEEELTSFINREPLWNILLYGREPPLIKKVVKQRFSRIDISYSEYLKRIKKYWYIQKYQKNYAIWLLSSELFNYLGYNTKINRIRKDEMYFSPVESKKWLIKCFLWYQKKEPIMFYINNVNKDFSKIREWLESMLPFQCLLLKWRTLKLGWESPTIPKIEIRYVLDKKHDWMIAFEWWEFEWIIKHLQIKYTFLWETKKFRINTQNRTVIDIVEHFYRAIMEFITSENFIDYNKILKVKYYDKSLEYKSIMNSFKSERIEGYLWAWMKMYYEQLRNRRKKVNNNGFILNK